MASGIIYRVPIARSDMGKYEFQKALEKKFVGDFLEMHSVEGVEYTLLDTKEKVDAYNDGTFFEKFVYVKKKSKKYPNCCEKLSKQLNIKCSWSQQFNATDRISECNKNTDDLVPGKKKRLASV